MSYTSRETVLTALHGIDLNSTADQSLTIPSNKYIIRRVIVCNASATPVLAAGGIYTGAGKTGSQVIGAGQVYSSLTATGKYLDLSLASIVTTDILTSGLLYFSLTTANGSAVTADIYVIGDDLE